MAHPDIRPVTRDCICPTRPTTYHTQECQTAFRAKFLGAWGSEREKFYRPRAIGTDGVFGLYADAPAAPKRKAS